MKKILTLLTITSFAILIGCASDPASVNSNAGITETQKQNENAEVVVANDNANLNSNTNANENTNAVGTALELSEDITDTEIDTSDWETYTNEEYGFSFKYPSEWEVKENNQKCWIFTSPETIINREQFNIDNPQAHNGTDAVPRSEISLCVKDQSVDVDVAQWGQQNTYKYVDEEYRGEAVFNNLPAYLIVDSDFGKSNNYFLKVNDIIYSVYYEIVNDSRKDQINLIAESIQFN